MNRLLICLVLGVGLFSCSPKTNISKPYVIEIASFKYKTSVDATDFWKEDARVESTYTSKQPGFISRESGYADNDKEVVVIVRWKTMADADASMKKFMNEESVKNFANMIDANTMKMVRYKVE